MSKIKMINCYKEYIKQKEKIVVLKDVNMNFELGKLYAVMGNSGAGKTTLLNVIGTLDKLNSGKILIDDTDITNLKENEKAQFRMKEIGFVFQEFYLNPNMTVDENIMQPLYINNNFSSNKERIKRVRELEEQVGLIDRKKHFSKELSGGEQQRVAIARALANNPNIILADEPTGNLDENNEIKIFTLLKELSEAGKCVIIVSHSNTVKEFADIVLKLEKGNLVVDENKYDF